jgi:hypothetical protein
MFDLIEMQIFFQLDDLLFPPHHIKVLTPKSLQLIEFEIFHCELLYIIQ